MPGLRFAIGVTAVLALVGALYYIILAREPALPAVVELPAFVPAQPQVIVRSVSGDATRRSANGGVVKLVVGDALLESDEVRTGATADAVIAAVGTAGASEVRLGADTVVGLGATGDFFLSQGSVIAQANGMPLVFGGAGTTGRVRVTGSARLLSDGARGLVVGGIRGQTLLENVGQQVSVGPNQVAQLRAALPPSRSWAIPASLLLKVRWPQATELASRKLRVTGEASPGSLIRVHGARALSDEGGRFSADIDLAEGVNTLSLTAEDAAGRKKQSEIKVRVDTTPADVGVETSPEMWHKRQ